MSDMDAIAESVAALANRGSILYTERLYSRAADKYAAAVSAAAAVQPVDNMVVALNQARQAMSLLADGYAFFNTAAALHAARTEVEPLLRAAMAVAQRRKDAGTLRTGACTAFEEAYEVAYTHAGGRIKTPNATAADVEYSISTFKAHLGYRCYITVGGAAVSFLAIAVHEEDNGFAAAHDALILQLYSFIASCLDYMRTVTLPAGLVFPTEKDVVRLLQKCIEEDNSIRDDVAPGKALFRAWRALLRSGVLKARGIQAAADADDRSMSNKLRVTTISPASRRCALAACNETEFTPGQFKACAACRAVVYCCKAHQSEDWPSHKAACKAARKKNSA